jgi:DNA-directed RNA polymerase subunit RPC12/RpoP
MGNTAPEIRCTFCGAMLILTIHGEGGAEYQCVECDATFITHYQIDAHGVTRIQIEGLKKIILEIPQCTIPTRCRLFKYPNMGKRGTLDETSCKYMAIGNTCAHPRRA